MYTLLHEYIVKKTAVSDLEFDELQRFFTHKAFKSNEFVLMSGEVCRFIYFVNSGCLRFYTTNESGQEMTRYFAFENKFGTALTSFITQEPSFESIQCLENTELLAIARKDFYALVETRPPVNLLYRDMLEMAYVTSQRRIYGLQGETAIERLRWLLNYQPTIFKRVSSKVIATYLGVTTYTLSRLKAEL